ncbi:unnamed protein product [Arabis nemorensis]|uniref:Uncharacterized protein n=1 Tax=Arabis nemorensis TaxID=586526 RepID=A0A565BAV9_9BRAS|nr:unnamed protein product [Arabis nemorensis]
MSASTCRPELAVANYLFHYRSSFNVGEDLKLLPVLTQPDIQGQSAWEEIFNEEEMLVIHRVHLEMMRSNLETSTVQDIMPALLCNEISPNNEIIVVEDDDDAVMEVAVVNIEGIQVDPPNSPASVELSACHKFGDVGLGLVGCNHYLVPPTTCSGIDDTMTFWQGVLPEGYNTPFGDNIQNLVDHLDIGVANESLAHEVTQLSSNFDEHELCF